MHTEQRPPAPLAPRHTRAHATPHTRLPQRAHTKTPACVLERVVKTISASVRKDDSMNVSACAWARRVDELQG